ncbi:NAD(P)/FAD-dependent oxidoreductase [Salsipaludibacter albus]|uniref:NAD(P)/FAD-dependent oxidoreductase n=1 Tax=Salsipaludibacter albus TaxID=2849650 RepID=UPI001EE45635|nr:FAD-binding oxidoreductase [Salsipaludibacter albus]
MQVVVVGAGVVGLMAAHALSHRGHAVEVLTHEDPLATTSATAGASFKPRLVDDSPLLRPLLVASRDVLVGWTSSGFATTLGIRRHRHAVVTTNGPFEGDWLDLVDDVKRSVPGPGAGLSGVAAPGDTAAVAFTTWFFDVDEVLPALLGHLQGDHAVVPRHRVVSRLEEVVDLGEVVVNATGVAASRLVGDPDVVAVRGTVVRVRSAAVADWDPDRSMSRHGSYVYPRRDGVLVGGTADWGAHDRTPDGGLARRLVDAAVHLAPGLADVRDAELEPMVGLRPWRRGGVRVERGTDLAGTPVIHAYGHGGAGWTLAPGTAERVADLVATLP